MFLAAFSTGLQRLSMCLQVLQLRPNRLLSCRPLAAVDIGVHPSNDLAGGTVTSRNRGAHLIESLVPVSALKRQPCRRIGDDRPVTRKQLNDVACGDQPLEEIERVKVRSKVTVRMRDHRRASTQHHVTGDQPIDLIRAGEQ